MSLLTLSDKASGRDARIIDMEQEKGKEVKKVVGQKKKEGKKGKRRADE